MREIKFRVYLDDFADQDTFHVMYYNAWIVEDSLYVKLDGNGYDILSVNDPDTYIMQFTGLKDKNGKEIYEGDIVRADNLWGEREALEIFWHQNIFGWGAIKYDIDDSVSEILEQDYVCSGLMGYQNFEIIGNIYENPELIQEVQHDQ